MERAKRGDAAALQDLCAAHWSGVYNLINGSIHNSTDSEELTQEVFERAIRSLPEFEYTGAPFSAYLTRIARNLLRDRWRSATRRETIRASIPPDAVVEESEPEAAALADSERAALMRALQTLHPDHRWILYMRIVEGLSSEEVARRMDRRPDAVRQLQRRAVTALRAAMNRAERQ